MYSKLIYPSLNLYSHVITEPIVTKVKEKKKKKLDF